ncbi:6725_t:CDS:2, partial [Funneliformis caledonium]
NAGLLEQINFTVNIIELVGMFLIKNVTSVDLTDTTPPSTPQPNSSHTPSKHRRPWLEHQIIDNKNFMFCTICQKAKGNSLWATSGCDTMKLEFVKRYENSVEYKNSLQILNPSQTGIKEDVNQMLRMSMDSVVTQMRNIYFFTSQNIVINIYPDLANLVNYQKEHPTSMFKQQKTSRSNYATYTNKVNGHELLVFLTRPIEEAVINEIKSLSCWSLLVDERITAVSDTSTESLLEVIDSFILQKGLPANKLYHLGSDGVSNMT